MRTLMFLCLVLTAAAPARAQDDDPARATLRGEDPFALSQRRMLEIQAEEGPPQEAQAGAMDQPPAGGDSFQKSGSMENATSTPS